MKLEFEYKNSSASAIIDEYCHNDTHADMLKLRYIRGHTYERIAEECGISVQTAKKIIAKYTFILDKIKESGV